MTTARRFLCVIQASFALLLPVRADGPPIRVALITPPHASILAGARAGAEEAKHTAQMFGREFHLTIIGAAGPHEASAAARRLHHVTAIVGGVTHEIADAIAGASKAPFLEILSIPEAGRPRPADARYRLVPFRSDRATVWWHHDLSRYGAGELNERFFRATGRRMDSDAWTAWLAMKIVVEAALRGRDIGAIRIDGHKGVPLHFDEHRVLQQPVYRIDAKGRIAE